MCGQTCQSNSDERMLQSYLGVLSAERMRTDESAHKLWTATLNQMALVNESIDEAISDFSNKTNPTKASCATHSDLSKSSLHKNIAVFTKLLCRFKGSYTNDVIGIGEGFSNYAQWLQAN